MSDKRTVVVIFGGNSSEHSISCATAAGILSAMDHSKFEVIPVGVTRQGRFVTVPEDMSLFKLGGASLPEVSDNGSRIIWPEPGQERVLRALEADGTERVLGTIDLVFPVMHGKFGEDGTIQGFLELLGLPYAGSGVLASAAAMDKHTTKVLLQAAGIPVVPWLRFNARDFAADAARLEREVAEFGFPVFIKPARAGSSVGVSKVSSQVELEAAFSLAFAEDQWVLVEQAVNARELECAVLAGRDGAAPRASRIGEIVVNGPEFYDFAAKYLDSPGIDLVCPAVISPELEQKLQELAVQTFTALGAETLARVDFFVSGEELWVNEINTFPGFTPISMYPRCWQESGLSYRELITELIEVSFDIVR